MGLGWNRIVCRGLCGVECMSTDIEQAIADLKAANVSVDRAKQALTELLGQGKVDDNWLSKMDEDNCINFNVYGYGEFEVLADPIQQQIELYMRFIKAIARENDKLGWVCDWEDCNQGKYQFFYNFNKNELIWQRDTYIQNVPTHLYMETSVVQVILSQFTEPEIISCITKGMLI